LPYANEEDAARSCAFDITRLLADAQRNHGRCVLSVAGGRSTELVLRHLRLDHPVMVICVDERWVGPESPERNDRLVLEHFGIEQTVRMPYSGHLESDARDWANLMWQYGTPDVALLSMADDGHVGSLFPERPTLHSHSTVVVESVSPKPPAIRLSMSVSMIRRIPHRLILAIGNQKAPMISQIRQGHQVPATRIKPTRWYLDSAASNVNGGGR
jgi:6-phosphogluconolactonase